jgi:ubiquinone/menaquinone biosynthesis C-methylase UbiE
MLLSTTNMKQQEKYVIDRRQKATNKNKVAVRNSERLSHLINVFQPHRSVTSILDIGCGNAEITQEIANYYKIKTVHGADVYPEKDFKQPDQNASVKYHQVANSQIDIADKSIDLVVCMMSIHHFDDFHKMMVEICRILKPRGWIFFREHDVGKDDHELKKTLDEMHKQYPDHPGDNINYLSRTELARKLKENYRFRFIKASDYPKHIRNKQAIYHALYLKE